MAFINKKEEVFDLTITEKGREKLAKGKFKPHSYSFYDNEIIYDNNWGDTVELQNATQTRIRRMPILPEQVTWDTSVYTPNKKDKLNYPNYFELGSYDYTKQEKPAWDISVLEGEITGAIKQYPLELERAGKVESLDDYKHDKIPQLNVFCEYEIYEEKVGDKVRVYVKRNYDDLKFSIKENKVFDDKENFILEVMQFAANHKDLKKLNFIDKDEQLDSNHVEYFFNITTDTKDVLDINYRDKLKDLEIDIPKDEC